MSFLDHFSEISLVQTIAVIVITILLVYALGVAVNKTKVTGRKKSAYVVLSDVLKYTVILWALVIILDINGFNVRGLVAGLGIAGAIVGIALQDMVKDIIMGIHITVDGFYYVGDAVVYDGLECVITEFNLRTTKLRVISDGSSIVICNRLIEKLHRMSNNIDIDIPVPYSTPTDVIRPLCIEMAKKISDMPEVDKAVFKGTEEFSDSDIKYRIRVMANPTKKYDILRAVNGLVQDEFNKAGIEIPFKQIDLHVIDMPKQTK